MMHVHLVFVSKYRKKLFTKEILNFMELIFRDVCTDFEAELKEFNGEGDHVHLLINYPPKVSVSRECLLATFESNNSPLCTNISGRILFGAEATLQALVGVLP